MSSLISTWSSSASPKSQPSSTSVHVAARSDVGRVRERNEDSFTVVDLDPDANPLSGRIEVGAQGVLLAVADGMGGHADGDVASAMAVFELTNAMRRSRGRTIDRVRRAVDHAHRSIREAAKGRFGSQRMGTTLTAVHIDATNAHIAHVGDSRAYVVRSGAILRLTHDQTFTELMIEAGILEESERELSPYAHQLIQALGQIERRLDVATSTLELRDGDHVVLCSDGLTNLISDEEIRATVMIGGPADAMCQRLVDCANQRGGEDNSTVVIAGVRGRLPPPGENESIASTHHVVQSFHSSAVVRALAG
jgi:serine/threonine protein phosphatase PrpC